MKKDIAQLDWNMLDQPMLQANHTWVLPQVFAFFNSIVRLTRVGSKISPSATLRAMHADLLDSRVRFQNGRVVSQKELTNLFMYINYSPRGQILAGSQTQESNRRYSAAVPLLLSVFKEYRSVGYQEWDYTDPAIVQWLDKDNQEVLQWLGSDFPDLDLLEIRETGRTVKSGAKAGRKTPYLSCTAITGINHPDFKRLPRLVKLMLCQAWVYHSTARHPLAWTNLLDLDSPAPPLVDTEVLEPAVRREGGKREEPTLTKLPWE